MLFVINHHAYSNPPQCNTLIFVPTLIVIGSLHGYKPSAPLVFTIRTIRAGPLYADKKGRKFYYGSSVKYERIAYIN